MLLVEPRRTPRSQKAWLIRHRDVSATSAATPSMSTCAEGGRRLQEADEGEHANLGRGHERLLIVYWDRGRH